MAAIALPFTSTWHHNFGIQELMPHGERTNSVLEQSSFTDGYLHPGEKPALGVALDVEHDVDEAGTYPCQAPTPARRPTCRSPPSRRDRHDW